MTTDPKTDNAAAERGGDELRRLIAWAADPRRAIREMDEGGYMCLICRNSEEEADRIIHEEDCLHLWAKRQPLPPVTPTGAEDGSVTKLRDLAYAAAIEAPGPWETPLKDLGSVDSFKAVDFYFDHSYESYPPDGFAGPLWVTNNIALAEYLGKVDPTSVLALLDTLAAANRRVLELEGANKAMQDALEDIDHWAIYWEVAPDVNEAPPVVSEIFEDIHRIIVKVAATAPAETQERGA